MLRHSDSGAYENAFPAYRERSLPTHEHSIPALSEDQPFPFSLRRLQCSHNLGAKKAPVVLELVKRRKQSCFAHGFEPEKSLSTCIGEPVCPGDFELHQSLQFKSAIDVFLQFILLGTVSVALNTSADLIVILLAWPLGRKIRSSAVFRRRQRIVTGAMMIGLGTYLATSESK